MALKDTTKNPTTNKTTKEDKKPNIGMVEIGSSGTLKSNGFIMEEYNSKLTGLEGIKKYEEMRSGDATVMASLLAMELPITSTKWEIKPGKTNGEITKQDEEIAKFIEIALFEKIKFKQFLRQSLTQLAFGYSVFEKVFKFEDGKIVWQKLAQRLQKSIMKWESESGEPGVVQYLQTTEGDKDNNPFIPRNKLVVFSHRQEGDNYEGKSALRAAYKHWYIKDQLYKYQAVGFEKQSVGIPVITMPQGAQPADVTKATEILEGIRSTEQSWVLLPSEKWVFEFADMKAKSNADPEKAILHHDRQIMKSVLAHFIELGATEAGSYALSEDQSSLFMLGLQSVADEIVETINLQAIEELVRINFDITENQTFPKLNYQALGEVDLEKMVNAITSASDSGIIGVDDKIEEKVRKLLDLPEMDANGSTRENKNQEEKAVVKPKVDPKDLKKPVKGQKKAETFQEEVKYFSEDTQVKENVAKKILSKIYQKGLEPKDLATVISNLKFKLWDKINIVKLLNKATDDEIDEVIDDLIDWKNEIGRNSLERRHDVKNFSEAEIKAMGFSDKEEMEYFKESKKIFNFIDSLNV